MAECCWLQDVRSDLLYTCILKPFMKANRPARMTGSAPRVSRCVVPDVGQVSLSGHWVIELRLSIAHVAPAPEARP